MIEPGNIRYSDAAIFEIKASIGGSLIDSFPAEAAALFVVKIFEIFFACSVFVILSFPPMLYVSRVFLG
jgi:hypothetical protein